MTAPLTPAASPSDSRVVVDCDVCHRTIWAGTRCAHGKVPEPDPDAPREVPLARLRGETGK